MDIKNGQKESIVNTFYKIAFLVYVPVFFFTKLVDFIAHTGWDLLFIAKISISLCALLFTFIGFLRYFLFKSPFGIIWLESFSTNLFKTRLIVIYILMIGFLFYEVGNQKAIHDEAPKFNWKLATTWGGSLKDLNAQLTLMAEEINRASKGQFQIQIYPAGTLQDKRGELIPALDLFDAVSHGDVEMIHSTAYYWFEKMPAAAFFGAIPFGMDHDEMDAWVEQGQEGYALWTELYSKFGVIPFPCGHTGQQMGGWFKKELHGLDDLKGLRMRIPALGGKVLARLGANTSGVEQKKIIPMLENNSLDAAEWIGPYHDHELGLDQMGMFYYEPGWQEPNTMFELVVNKAAYEKLPPQLQTLLDITTRKYNVKIYESINRNNGISRETLMNSNVPFRKFPQSIIDKLREITPQVLEAHVALDRSGMAQKIYDSYKKFTHKYQ